VNEQAPSEKGFKPIPLMVLLQALFTSTLASKQSPHDPPCWVVQRFQNKDPCALFFVCMSTCSSSSWIFFKPLNPLLVCVVLNEDANLQVSHKDKGIGKIRSTVQEAAGHHYWDTVMMLWWSLWLKYQREQLNRRRIDLFWFIVSEVSVHHGREGIAEQRHSHPADRK
jgi:hypothetical protein